MSWVESISSLIGESMPPGRVQPMYGVSIVKYGPPPSPVPYDPGSTGLPVSGFPGFDWSGMWRPPSFTMPDLGHLGLSFPKFMAGIAFVAFVAVTAITISGLALRGTIWYLKNRK